MITDKLSTFASAVSVAAAAGTALIGDVIDLTVARDIGVAIKPVYLGIQINTAVITGGAAGTVQFKLVSDAQAAIATDGTATVHWESRLFVTDDVGFELVVGYKMFIPLPMENPVYERFLGILATTATTTTTAGKIDAFLTLDPQKWKALPNAI